MLDVAAILSVENEHLLKRELLRLEMNEESARIDNLVNIDALGKPFVRPNGTYDSGSEFPIFRYVLSNFLVTSPLLKNAHKEFWVDSAQPFIQGLASKDISSSADRDEATKRRRISRGIKRTLLMLFVAGLGSNRKKTPKPSPSADESSEAPGVQVPEQPIEPAKLPELPPGPYSSVIGVREVPSRNLFQTKHSEYIVEAQFAHVPPIWVARSWDDFKTLEKKLIEYFPGKVLPKLPVKVQKNTTTTINGEKVVLLREQQRLSLRYYLSKICASPRISNSEPFLDFLFKDPIELSDSEIKDIKLRIELQKMVAQELRRFLDLAAERENRLNETIGEVKKQILLEDALPGILYELKTRSQVEDMSPLMQRVVEWCDVHVATFLYETFIARDDGSEFYSQIYRLHSLMPYKVVQGILKLSNPALILKKLTDVFMATPFGSQSLLQTMFIRILNDDMRSQDTLIAELESKVKNPELIEALTKYSWTDHYTREAIHSSTSNETDIVVGIFETFNSPCLKDVVKWHEKWQLAVKNEVPDDDPDVERYSQLKDLLKLKVRQRDKQILSEFWADPSTIRFIRNVVNLLYDVFIDVFRHAGISESVGDFEKFMTEVLEFLGKNQGGPTSAHVVEDLIDILQRHQNSIFRFLNRVFKRDSGFFADSLGWSTLVVNFVKDGKSGLHNLDLLGLLATADNVDVEKVVKELDSLQSWLDHRRKTASGNINQPTTDDFPVGQSNLDISDVGLSWDDVEYGFAELETDIQEEFLPEMQENVSQDAVTREKYRRLYEAESDSRKAQMEPRPSTKEIEKVLPAFQVMLGKVLNKAVIEPTDIGKLSLDDDRIAGIGS